jgi:hypothetical protein
MSCDHEVSEKQVIKHDTEGHIISKCRLCDRRIWAKKIDHEYFKDTGEIVVLEWEVA